MSFSLTYFTEHRAHRGLSMSQVARFQGRIDEHLVLPFGFESSHLSRLVLLRTGSFYSLLTVLSQVRSHPHCILKHRSGE